MKWFNHLYTSIDWSILEIETIGLIIMGLLDYEIAAHPQAIAYGCAALFSFRIGYPSVQHLNLGYEPD